MNKKFLIIVVVLAFFVISLLILFSFLGAETKVVATSLDKQNKISPTINSISLTFSRNAKSCFDEPSFVFKGSNIVGSSSGLIDLDKEDTVSGSFSYEGKKLIFLIDKNTPLVPSSKYIVSFRLKSYFGRQSEKTIEFTTDDVRIDVLSDAQQKILMSTIDIFHDGRVVGHEITKYLPYENNLFKFDYKYNEEEKTVLYTTYYKTTESAAKIAVETWIKSKRFDPKSINIQYLRYPGL